MDLTSGYPYSLVRNGLPFDYPKLTTDIKVDVAVIGGGISGALTAYYLTQAGYACAVFDKRTIGLGSTVTSTSLLQYELDLPLSKLQHKIGKSQAIRAYQYCGDSVNTLAGIAAKLDFKHFSFRSSLYYAASSKDIPLLHDELRIRREAGFEIDYLERSDIRKQFGFDAPGALLSGLAGQTDAYLLTHELHQYNLARGGRVYDRTNISDIDHRQRSVRLKTESGPVVNARYVVFANGYEAINYIDEKILDLKSTYVAISEQQEEKSRICDLKSVIWNTGDPYLYMRVTTDRRVLVGGRDEDGYHPKKRDRLLVRKAGLLVSDFNKLFPDVPFKRELSWAGTFGSTDDSLPYIGAYPKRPNGLFALGYGGNGITFSVIAAELITALIAGKKHRNMDLFSFDRKFTRNG